MAREVSSHTANATLEAGDYFGISRERLMAHFQHPEELNHRRGRVDWTDYLSMVRELLGELGSGPDLVPLGQEYLRNKFKTRNAHYYAQFTSWEKALWVTKHYMAGRMIRGYAVDYTKLGPDHFHVVMTLDPSLEGDADYLYFLTGVWTGSSTLANLENRIENLVVTPNRCEADIQFDSRSFASRAIHNPLYCRWKTWRELRREQKEQQDLLTRTGSEQRNLSSAMEAVSDAVFDLSTDEPENLRTEASTLRTSPSPLPRAHSFLLRPDRAIENLRQIYEAGVKTQEELDTIRNRYRLLFDAVSDGLFVFHQGELVLANREAGRILETSESPDLCRAAYEAGLRLYSEEKDSRAPVALQGFPHLLALSCTTLELEEGASYLVSITDLSPALNMSQRVEELSVRERRRIARDLHDGLSQLLSSLSFQAKALCLQAGEEQRGDLDLIANAAQNCLRLGAKITHELGKI